VGGDVQEVCLISALVNSDNIYGQISLDSSELRIKPESVNRLLCAQNDTKAKTVLALSSLLPIAGHEEGEDGIDFETTDKHVEAHEPLACCRHSPSRQPTVPYSTNYWLPTKNTTL
jgi:hypothetical protein